MNTYLNIAGYTFFSLEDITSFQEKLLQFCNQLQIKGTILLGQEGVNLYVCGLPENIEQFQQYIHGEIGIPKMEYKKSWSDAQPFRRMLVKIKKEIITMGFDDINPALHTGPHISPQKLKNWLDQDKDIYFLDVRNDYEIEHGKFEKALDLNVKSFTEFANKAKEIPEEMKEKPVVMYCTGGIRCEKASSLFLNQYGFKEVYQLEGGILKYFEECGGNHYKGDCFVFDERVCVNNKLEPKEEQQ